SPSPSPRDAPTTSAHRGSVIALPGALLRIFLKCKVCTQSLTRRHADVAAIWRSFDTDVCRRPSATSLPHCRHGLSGCRPHRRSAGNRRHRTPPDRRGYGVGGATSRDAGAQVGGIDRKRMSMPKKALPRIVSVAPGKKALTLKLRWNTGDDTLVDVSGPVNSFRFY